MYHLLIGRFIYRVSVCFSVYLWSFWFFCFKVLSFSSKIVVITITLVTLLFMSWIYLIIFQARKKFLICLFKSFFDLCNLFISFILSHNLCFQVLRSCRHVGLWQWNTCPFFSFLRCIFFTYTGVYMFSSLLFFPLFSCAWFVCFVLLSPLGNLPLLEFIFRDNVNFRNNFNGFRQVSVLVSGKDFVLLTCVPHEIWRQAHYCPSLGQ